jgi:hypothetical protein
MVHKQHSVQLFNDRVAIYRKRLDAELARLRPAQGGTKFLQKLGQLDKACASYSGLSNGFSIR